MNTGVHNINAKLVNHRSAVERIQYYTLEVDGVQYTLIERFDFKSGQAVDVELRDENGWTIDDPAVVEQAQTFIAGQVLEQAV